MDLIEFTLFEDSWAFALENLAPNTKKYLIFLPKLVFQSYQDWLRYTKVIFFIKFDPMQSIRLKNVRHSVLWGHDVRVQNALHKPIHL